MTAALLIPSSDASWTDSEWSHFRAETLSCASVDDAAARGAGKLLGGELGGVDLDELAEIRDVVVTHDGTSASVSSPSATPVGNDAYANPLTLEALNSVTLGLENLLAFPLDAGTGLVNQYGQARDTGVSVGAAGAVTNSGGISLGPGAPSDLPQFATLELGSVLERVIGNGAGTGIANLADARLGVGAVASSVALDSCEGDWHGSVYSGLERNYAVAGLEAELDSPVVGALAASANGILGALETQVSDLAGPTGVVNDILGLLLGPEGLGPILGTLLIDPADAAADLGLSIDLGAVRNLLTEPIRDSGETLSIDLARGSVVVDLATLLGPAYQQSVGINGLAPNTELLLNADAVGALVAAVTDALQEWSASLAAAVDQALGMLRVQLSVTVPVELLNALGLEIQVATLKINVGGTAPGQGASLAALRSGDATVSVSLERTGICTGTLGGVLCNTLSGVINRLTSFAANAVLGPLIAGVLDDALAPVAAGLVPNLQAASWPLISFLSSSISGLFGPESVLSIVVNAQNQPDPASRPSNPNNDGDAAWPELNGTGQYDVAALRLEAAGVSDFLRLDLARSSAGPNSLP